MQRMSESHSRTVERVISWYAANARPLPWREGATPWAILVSEIMLQQTPVARVLPVWNQWIEQWPTPTALAREESGEAIRAWGRLGYPRRAQRLHQSAQIIRDQHAGEVPDSLAPLLALPGVGTYTAAAVLAFAFGQRHLVLDTNVRRVLARLDQGCEFPPEHLTRSEQQRAERWVPTHPGPASTWAAASMELGALVCTSTSPGCTRCPVADACRWRADGYPAWAGRPRRGQPYAGTDRQCRGALLAVLRNAEGSVPRDRVLAAWTADPAQAERALQSLLTDGLIRQGGNGLLQL